MSQNQKTLGRWKEIWRLAGRVNLRQRLVMVTTFSYPLLGTALYEGTAYGYTNPRFWLAVPISYLLFVLSYLIVSWPFKKFPRISSSTMGKLTAVYFAYLIKTWALLFVVAGDFEGAFELWVVRAPGDATLTIVAWLAFATAIVASNDYRLALSKLNSVTEELDLQRKARALAAESADRQLRALALEKLNPELERIRKGLRSVKEGRDAWRLSAEIKNLVSTKVRPLSQDLIRRLDLLADLRIQTSRAITPTKVPSLRARPRIDSRFGLAYIGGIPNIFVTVAVLSNIQVAAQVLLVSLSYPVIAWALTLVWPSRTRLSILVAIAWGTFVGTVSYLPTLLVLHYFSSQFIALEVIRITAFIVLIFLAASFSFWATFQRSRDEQLGAITEEQEMIKREIALIDQALWLARRRWAYLIHGSVQGALTVAGSRLVYDPEPSEKVLKRVLLDVESARKALQGNGVTTASAEELVAEIRESWRGVCETSFEIGAQVFERLNESQEAKACFVEIAKELVSNAYRHGSAKQIWISALLLKDGDIKLISTNDGVPMSGSETPGIGFEMFDQLTSGWRFESENQARFVARLPLPN